VACYLANLQNLIQIIQSAQYASICILFGFILAGFSAYYSYKLLNTNVADTPPWYKFIVFFGLGFGIIFIGGGGIAISTHVFDTHKINLVSKEEAIKRLGINARTSWLIRLIPFSKDQQPYLGIDQIKKLGPPELQYVFVASYDDLKGYSVRDAVAMIGGSMEPDQRVTAIIFRTKQIYPANARGLTQVIRKIEKAKLGDGDEKLTDISILDKPEHYAELKNLDQEKDRDSWSWSNYNNFFPHYCWIVEKFRCNLNSNKGTYSAHRFISEIDDDWSPLGYARTARTEQCSKIDQMCARSEAEKDWDTISKEIDVLERPD
jgi:hypothetical protein